MFLTMATMAKPESSSEVVAVAFNLALDMWSLLHDKPSGVVSLNTLIFQLPFSTSQHLQQPLRLVAEALLHSKSLKYWVLL